MLTKEEFHAITITYDDAYIKLHNGWYSDKRFAVKLDCEIVPVYPSIVDFSRSLSLPRTEVFEDKEQRQSPVITYKYFVPCSTCGGAGETYDENENPEDCEKCDGNGEFETSSSEHAIKYVEYANCGQIVFKNDEQTVKIHGRFIPIIDKSTQLFVVSDQTKKMIICTINSTDFAIISQST